MIGTLLLNRYELLEKIGEGGMGTVYKAKCHLLNRFVAIKILKAELSNDEEFVARFKREATSIARLSHPNIVNVHDVGTENQINFIVMEYIDGKTLKQIIKENGRIDSQKTLDIVFQVAKALESAHKNNIIHRDIKPDNIMVMEDNRVKVMDFGIAKVADSGTMTSSNSIMGTVRYFAPEQAKGNLVDCRTDIYSLGIVMYEMVTGQVPYNAESSISIAMMHIQEPVIPPIEIFADIPENINQVILKSMQKEPIKRYQTAGEMADVLKTIRDYPNFKTNTNNVPDDATCIMGKAAIANIGNDFTVVTSQASEEEKTMMKTDKVVPFTNKKLSKNKKTMIIMASIILVMIVAILGRLLTSGKATTATTTTTKAPIVKTTALPVVEKKVVPSLIGNTQDTANLTIVNNGFLLGNITKDYSDTIEKGLVISQTPGVNTSYEEGSKIDLVISLGKKVAQVTSPPEVKGKDKKKNKH